MVSNTWRYLFLLFVVVSVSTAAEYVEDFEYANPTGFVFSNGVFNHSITSLYGASRGFDILDTGVTGIDNALYLYPAYDDLTFSLGTGESVEWVSFDCSDASGGSAYVTVYGTESNYTYYPAGPTWVNWDSRTASLPSSLGDITGMQISASQGGFDNITIGVVPEPVSVVLLVTGGIAMFRRRGCKVC